MDKDRNLMLPVLQIGPLALQTPGLVLLLGLWLGLAMVERNAARQGADPDRLYNLVLTALLVGVAGARLGYAARYPAVFLDNPLSLLSLNPGLLDLPSGMGLGLIAALVYAQRRHMALWPTLDALAPGLAVFAVALGLSHLASGAAFGAPTGLPWGIQLWGARRHPSQIYEMILAGLILWALFSRKGPFRLEAPGSRFLVFVALSAGARLFLEAFRGDSAILAGGLRTAQVAAWFILAASLWGLEKLRQAQEAPGRS